MFVRPSIAQASLGLSLVFALIQPALSQISANGAGTIVNPQGNQINITGGTQAGVNLFHSFQDFNVNAGQVANFLSNPQTQNIFGRINGGNPSVINGLLQVTGGNSNLFLMNPAGIIFGQGASLNVPASFTATTANQIGFSNHQYFSAIGENNFSALVGNPNSFLFNTNESGSIVNAGNLAVTSGQSISLIGGNIVNTGNINAGNITLAAVPGTNRVRISQPGHLLSLEITPSADSLIAPLDLPRLLTGQSLPGISSNGETVEVNGIGIPAGQGVNVTSGNLGTFSQAGTINVLGDRVALLGANLNASGVEGGGTIRVGGEYRGGGNNPFNSRITYVDASSFLSADALNAGDGGRVIVWGDDVTRFYGNISARGGANGGNGGFAEVSGAQTLTFAGNADLSAPRGSFGTLLLDPVNIFINNGADALGGCALPTILSSCNPLGDITISEATLEALGAAANIVLEASNNITFGTLTGGSLNFATCTIGTCGDISFTAGGAFNTNGNNIVALGRNLTIEAANITAGNIDTSIAVVARDGGDINLTATGGDIRAGLINSGSSNNSGDSGFGGNIRISASNGNFVSTDRVDSRSVVDGTGASSSAGDITITAQDITAGIIVAYSRVNDGTTGNGGNVTVRATNGNVTARGITSLSGASISGSTGIGGNITLDATNDINITGVSSTTLDPRLLPNIFALDSRALSITGGDAGNGGNIRINQNLVSNGNFLVTGEINSSSGVTNPLSNATGNSARGGDIFITARNVTADRLNAYSYANIGNASDGGNIAINAQNNLTIDRIDSSSISLTTGNSGNGGNTTLNAQNDLTVNGIFSESNARIGNSGNGGNTTLNAQNDLTVINIIYSPSSTGTGNSGNGGNTNLNAQNNLTVDEILPFSSTGTGNSGNGGNTNLNAQNNLTVNVIFPYSTTFITGNSGNGGNTNLNAQNNLTVGIIGSGSRTVNGNSGNGGNIILNARNGSTSLDWIDADSKTSSTGTGGRVDINTGNLFLSTGNIPARDGTLASISTQGGVGGGAITITHGGSTSSPFLVGNATNNGTVAAITSGSGANTINNLFVPVPPDVNNYGTNISIRTTAPIVPAIDPTILILLTTPTPPTTPSPVIVGTPPTPPGVANLPESLPPVIPTIDPLIIPPTPTPNLIIPTIDQTILTITPPNNPSIIPRLDRPILDANSPGSQSPLSLAATNSSIPIIDRIPVDSQNNKIRLLDDPFKTEFQAYSGISDEIATLDVNQAQEILQRIMRETNTKPVFIYVFFAPENDTERTVNSARGLSSPLRVAQDTDILEVVLVPPTGDLIRVRHPGLKRPQVMETAQRFVSLTASQSNGYIGSARQLHEWIISDLQDELKKREINNLVFLMDVGLRSIPLAAMRDQKNGDRFIIEDYSVGLMPSLTLTDTSYTSLRGSEVLGMGAATFVAEKPLPAVPLELNAINQMWGGNTLINENFTLNNLRQARRPAQRIVHLATHGVFAPGEKSNSYIQLWGNERLTLDQIRQAGWGTPPVDLLVISACETALGDKDAELGFAGLAVQAGVKSALASLWRVSDDGTLGLMTEFYKQLQETTTKSEALRLAQLAMLRGEVRLEGGNLITPQGTFPLNEELRGLGDRSLRHPYFWSGFTMVGNPW